MLLEWLFERKNPGPVGTIDVQSPETIARGPVATTIHGLIGLAMIGGGVSLALQARNPLLVLGGIAIYLVFAHFVHPKPNRENLGWAGGLIDHPLKWSDDHNRILLFLQIVLFPGRFATTGVRNLARHVLAARSAPKQLHGVVWERRDHDAR
jgi:hypothetical protein